MRRNLGDCAVVLGGSMAGLLAARVLAERFATVVVVERDRLPNGPEPRRGVPQGKHIHGLLAGGQQAIEQLLPGLTKTWRRTGCRSVTRWPTCGSASTATASGRRPAG